MKEIISLPVGAFFYGTLRYWFWLIASRFPRPLICVCRINGFVGIVLQRDFHKASRKYWWQFRLGRKNWDWNSCSDLDKRHSGNYKGHLITVDPVFTLDDSLERSWFEAIAERCYVEQATFYVPPASDCKAEARRARQYLFGE